jgi:hypothetical protein
MISIEQKGTGMGHRTAAAALAVTLALSACTADNDTTVTADDTQAAAPDTDDDLDASEDSAGNGMGDDASFDELEELGDVEVDRGLLNVEVTIPAGFFDEADMDQVLAEAEADGIREATVNDDGSVTYRMSRAQHRQLMAEMRDEVTAGLRELADDFDSIEEVIHNRDLTRIEMVVDRAAFENSFDGFAIFGIGIITGFYHLFNGSDPDGYRVTIEVVDQATGETFDTTVIPDDFEDWGNDFDA